MFFYFLIYYNPSLFIYLFLILLSNKKNKCLFLLYNVVCCLFVNDEVLSLILLKYLELLLVELYFV